MGKKYFMMAIKEGSYSLKLEQVQLNSMLGPIGGIRKGQRIAWCADVLQMIMCRKWFINRLGEMEIGGR